MRIHSIIHADFEQRGYFNYWAQQQAATVTVSHIDKGDALPSPDTFDLLLCMGGPQSPLRMDKYPYLRDEIALIESAIAADKPVLGVCLGAQLIGESYGAQAERSPYREIGVFPVQLTEAGQRDPNFQDFPATFLSAHWHDDMPGVPKGAEVLAHSAGCPRQIIRYSPKVYGFQCHLEFDKDGMQALLEHCGGQLSAQPYVQMPEVILSQNYHEINQHLHHFLQRFTNRAD